MATLERFGPAGHDLVMVDEGRGRISVGTSAHNDLVIDSDAAVSRVHAVLEHVGPAWCITDVGSSNGTTVNGERHIRASAAVRPRRDRHRTDAAGRPRRRGQGRRHHGAPAGRPGAYAGRAARARRALPPVLSGQAFTPPSSVRTIADALYVTESAVKQHLDRLYDKFGIQVDAGGSRRVLLANEAIQSAAVSLKDLQPPERDAT